MLINIYNYQFKSSVSSVFCLACSDCCSPKGNEKGSEGANTFLFFILHETFVMKMQLQASSSLYMFPHVRVCVYVCFTLFFASFCPFFFNVVWLESFKYDFICAASCGCFAYLTRMQLICSAAKNTKVAAKEILNNIIQFFCEFSFFRFKVSCDKIRSLRQYYSLRS